MFKKILYILNGNFDVLGLHTSSKRSEISTKFKKENRLKIWRTHIISTRVSVRNFKVVRHVGENWGRLVKNKVKVTQLNFGVKLIVTKFPRVAHLKFSPCILLTRKIVKSHRWEVSECFSYLTRLLCTFSSCKHSFLVCSRLQSRHHSQEHWIS